MPWYVWGLWSFTSYGPLHVLAIAVVLAVAFGSGSTGLGIVAGLGTFAVGWFGFPRLIRRLMLRRAERG